MKNLLKVLFLFTVSVVIAGCGGNTDADDSGSNESEGETITLTAGTNLPSEHYLLRDILRPMLERIEEETDGQVEFEVYDSESLVRAGEELEALRSGTIDIALPMYDVYDPSRFPFSELPLLPLTDSSMEVYSAATVIMNEDEEPYEDGLTHQERMYGEKDLLAWPFTLGRSYTIGTVTDPIESISEFESMQIRVPSNVHEIYSRNLGFSPSNISANEAYDAFNRGTLDGGFTPITDWTSYGLDEVFEYVIEGIHAGSWPTSVAMQQETFDELPEDVQEVFTTVISEHLALETNPEVVDLQNDIEDEITQSFLDQGGTIENLEDLPPEIQERVENAVAQTWLDWIDNQESNGEPGKEAAIKWRDAVLEAGGDVPDEIKELE